VNDTSQPKSLADRIERTGIQCPKCRRKMRVAYTRNGPGEKIRRVRFCPDCRVKIRTFELVVDWQSS
jgi:transcriptional regulator NrdR family protein